MEITAEAYALVGMHILSPTVHVSEAMPPHLATEWTVTSVIHTMTSDPGWVAVADAIGHLDGTPALGTIHITAGTAAGLVAKVRHLAANLRRAEAIALATGQK